MKKLLIPILIIILALTVFANNNETISEITTQEVIINTLSPDDGSVFGYGDSVTFTVDSNDLVSATLYINNSVGWDTYSASISGTTASYTKSFVLGTKVWKYEVCSSTNCSFTENRTIIINDVVPPIVVLNGPANNTIGSKNWWQFNCTVSDEHSWPDRATFYDSTQGNLILRSTLFWFPNNPQLSINNIMNTPKGTFQWRCGARDQYGNWAYSGIRYFTNDYPAPVISSQTLQQSENENITCSSTVSVFSDSNFTFDWYVDNTLVRSTDFSGKAGTYSDVLDINSYNVGSNVSCNISGTSRFGTSNSDSSIIIDDLEYPVIISIELPNNTVQTDSFFSSDCTASDNVALRKVSLFCDFTTEFMLRRIIWTTDSYKVANLYFFNVSQGIYTWACQACDNSSNCVISENRTFIRDYEAPQINSQTLERTSDYFTEVNCSINTSVYTNSNFTFDWHVNNSLVKSTTRSGMYGLYFDTLNISSYAFGTNILCNITATSRFGTSNSSSSIEKLDLIPPVIKLLIPENNTVLVKNNGWYFNASVSDISGHVKNSSIYHNIYSEGLSWRGTTFNITSRDSVFVENSVPKGTFQWKFDACDYSSNCAVSEIRTFTNDYPAPQINTHLITSPTNKEYDDLNCSSEIEVYTDSNITMNWYVNNSLIKTKNFSGQFDTYSDVLNNSNFGYAANVSCNINTQSRFGTNSSSTSIQILDMQCYNIDYTNSSVCSSNGVCISENTCSCDSGYFGNECQIKDLDLDGFNSSVDCNDNNSSIYPGATEIVDNGEDDNCDGKELCYLDADGDGYRPDSTSTVLSSDLDCTDLGEARSSDPTTDCDDTRFAINPGATELPCDGIDNDCNSQIDETRIDADGDGVDECSDCADNNANRYPGNTELPCDEIDNDCNSQIDETRVDSDGDGVDECSDCADDNANIFPGNTELCNYIDDNCDSVVDEGVTTTYYLDLDNDNFGINSTVQDCSVPTNYSSILGDCDDNNSLINPDASESCNYLDDDCDSLIDENVTTVYYLDLDGDGYGVNITINECTLLTNYSTILGDCNDNNYAINPDAIELSCDEIDNDCDGNIDETRVDSDGDGVDECSDCADDNANLFPGNTELPCDGIDNDCNSQIDETRVDADGDGVDECSDCADDNADRFPGNVEVCDYLDNDCNSQVDENVTTTYYLDLDNDNFGINSTVQDCSVPTNYSSVLGDCDDNNSLINPDASESCNYLDDNCNSEIDENVTTIYYLDLDGDGYGINVTINECTLLTNYSTVLGDCNDNSSGINPNATEICGNGIDEDCSGADLKCARTGGGGGSTCNPDWKCTEWGECTLFGIRTRTCTDSENCNKLIGKPSEEEFCLYEIQKENNTQENKEVVNQTKVINETKEEISNKTIEPKDNNTSTNKITGNFVKDSLNYKYNYERLFSLLLIIVMGIIPLIVAIRVISLI
ncbi:putative metal-binding motif-containing protein [Candidatus Woesearchaeota archaeon]|nr:putative metal-binding motif-containing protein [Candidatus Woesearchaeota archaeon]